MYPGNPLRAWSAPGPLFLRWLADPRAASAVGSGYVGKAPSSKSQGPPLATLACPDPALFFPPIGYDDRMSVRRRQRGFEPAGEPRGGLSPRVAARLRLGRAWLGAAGAALAATAELELLRGTLRVRPRDDAARTLLAPVIDEIVGRIAGDCPDLAIRRLRFAGDSGSRPVQPLPPSPQKPQRRSPTAARRSDQQPTRRADPPDPAARERRLQELARRYVSRSNDGDGDPGTD